MPLSSDPMSSSVCFDFPLDLHGAELRQIDMAIAVVSNLMSVFENPPDDCETRLIRNFSTNHEKGGFYAKTLEVIEQAGRRRGIRPVIKGQTNPASWLLVSAVRHGFISHLRSSGDPYQSS